LLLFAATAALLCPKLSSGYYHTGNSKQEFFSNDRIVVEPLLVRRSGQGHRRDNLGKYFFEVRDQNQARALLAGFRASIFGEWKHGRGGDLDAKRSASRCVFPVPDAPVEIVLKKEDAKNAGAISGPTAVDPTTCSSIAP